MVLAAGFFAASVFPAAAQDWFGTFDDWSAFQYAEGGGKVCYVSSTPLDMSPKNVRRGDVFMQVVHNTGDDSRNVVSIIAGYAYEESSVTVANIGGAEFRLFTDGDAAWNPTTDQDGDMIAAMIRGSRLVVTGVSARGTQTTDVYSLLGFTAAHKAISEACGE